MLDMSSKINVSNVTSSSEKKMDQPFRASDLRLTIDTRQSSSNACQINKKLEDNPCFKKSVNQVNESAPLSNIMLNANDPTHPIVGANEKASQPSGRVQFDDMGPSVDPLMARLTHHQNSAINDVNESFYQQMPSTTQCPAIYLQSTQPTEESDSRKGTAHRERNLSASSTSSSAASSPRYSRRFASTRRPTSPTGAGSSRSRSKHNSNRSPSRSPRRSPRRHVEKKVPYFLDAARERAREERLYGYSRRSHTSRRDSSSERYRSSRTSAERARRSPDRSRRSPERNRRSPDRSRRSPDRRRRSSERRRYESHRRSRSSDRHATTSRDRRSSRSRDIDERHVLPMAPNFPLGAPMMYPAAFPYPPYPCPGGFPGDMYRPPYPMAFPGPYGMMYPPARGGRPYPPPNWYRHMGPAPPAHRPRTITNPPPTAEEPSAMEQ